jgi:hypothetical protein
MDADEVMAEADGGGAGDLAALREANVKALLADRYV